ncbi:shikimate dehydrogenase [Aquipuribacter sp. SD81]|uniref:shikimate dehydrogenase n=1 Tax=Aquipuribacter sp. SD81 TaxID=3127703 RepID=UPI003017E1C7
MTDDVAAAAARRAAVLGSPVAHSLSPVLHTAAWASLGLEGWTYERREVDAAGLAGLVDDLDADPAWVGLSLTMPLKQAVLPLLDTADEAVDVTGACNTLVWGPAPDGARRARHGANTDVAGIVAALQEVAPGGPGWAPAVAHVLGGGATAASTILALRRLGCPTAVVHVRDPARAGAVTAAAQRCGSAVELRPWPDAGTAPALAAADVVVSTVPGGAADAVAALVPRRVQGVLLDVAYEPWPSALARAWAGAGGAVAPGSLMLLHQAVEQVALMTGRRPEVAPMRVALAAARPDIPL